jgi:hypothetical protein
MPTRRFALEQEGPKRLELSWKGRFKNVDVLVDGQSIGVVPNRAALKEGRVFALPDSSSLSLKLRQGAFNSSIELKRNGVPLPGSDTDARTQVKTAGQLVYFVAALNALLGLAVLVFNVKSLEAMAGANGIGAFFMAGLYSVLAFFTMGGSAWALIASMLIYSLDWVYGVIASVQAGGHANGGGVVVRIIFLTFMFRGVRAAFALKKERAVQT